MSHIGSIEKHINTMCPNLTALLGNRAMVAGGFTRDLLIGVEPKDLDIFVADIDSAAMVRAYLNAFKVEFDYIPVGVYGKKAKYTNDIQIINVGGPIISYIWDTFDYRMNTVAYDGTNVFEVVPGAIVDCMSRRLTINNLSNVGKGRAKKFSDLGWT